MCCNDFLSRVCDSSSLQEKVIMVFKPRAYTWILINIKADFQTRMRSAVQTKTKLRTFQLALKKGQNTNIENICS